MIADPVWLAGYLWTNVYMGLGIAADVYAATLARFSEFGDRDYRRKWIRRNTITHTVFPLVGMYLVVFGVSTWHALEGVLFAVGAGLLGLFLILLVRDKVGGGPLVDPPPDYRDHDGVWAWLMKRAERLDPQWPLVLGVSMDAIYSGFAKAADTRDWGALPLAVSFPLVGLVVGVAAWLAARKAVWILAAVNGRALVGARPSDVRRRLVLLQAIALVLEFAVLGYFFWRSLITAISAFEASGQPPDRLTALVAAASSTLLLAALLGRLVWRRLRIKVWRLMRDRSRPVGSVA